MRRGILIAVALGVFTTAGAAADPGTPPTSPAAAQACGHLRCAYKELDFATVGSSWTGRSPDPPGNHVSIFRNRRKADAWADYVGLNNGHAFVRKTDFAHKALVGVFLFDRADAQAVSVTHARLIGDTLERELAVVVMPVYVDDTPPGRECAITLGPGITMVVPRHSGPHGFPYTLAAFDWSALAGVHRRVVVSESDVVPEVHYVRC